MAKTASKTTMAAPLAAAATPDLRKAVTTATDLRALALDELSHIGALFTAIQRLAHTDAHPADLIALADLAKLGAMLTDNTTSDIECFTDRIRSTLGDFSGLEVAHG